MTIPPGRRAAATGRAAWTDDRVARSAHRPYVGYKARASKTFSFKEADGDRVRLRVQGGGHMLYFLPIRGRSSPAIFMRETNPTTSILTGTVKQGRNGDGVIDIAQISAASTAQIPILTDPAYRIRNVMP